MSLTRCQVVLFSKQAVGVDFPKKIKNFNRLTDQLLVDRIERFGRLLDQKILGKRQHFLLPDKSVRTFDGRVRDHHGEQSLRFLNLGFQIVHNKWCVDRQPVSSKKKKDLTDIQKSGKIRFDWWVKGPEWFGHDG